ncbi:MAG: hypothetical protein ABI672_15685, partial [Vicinamibacteria bacterium]
LLPENQNHHWCYGVGFQNRRDYNPDGWFMSGSWQWLNADAPRGTRRLVLEAPKAEARQRVNWITVHDDRKLDGFPDAGGFPVAVIQRSPRPLTVVRDLTFRVRVRGEDVVVGGASLELGLSAPGKTASDDPMGTQMPLLVSASLVLPSGTYASRWIEVKLPAALWLKAMESSADPSGIPLPGAANVAIRYAGPTGRVEVERAELVGAPTASPNLIPNGGFETAAAEGWPDGWSRPSKYRYFPPALYYLFNTWNNGPFENRGLVARDALIHREGGQSLKMIVPSGDEVQVLSAPIVLNQVEPRLIEVRAWVKTDQLNMLQIDGLAEDGTRLDGFNFIHKAPVSIGTDEWRELRQVFRPRKPIRSLRLVLAARGVNGYTLGDTGETPQANATGTLWWDGVRVFEPESSSTELTARGLRPELIKLSVPATPYLVALDLGERMAGANHLRATVINAGDTQRMLSLIWRFVAPDGRKSETRSTLRAFAPGERAEVVVPYELPKTPLAAYAEPRGEVQLVDRTGKVIGASTLWFSTWAQPIDLELGALYLSPKQQKQFVRMNLGLSSATMATVASVRLEIVRRKTNEVLESTSVPATPPDIEARRGRIPIGLREDFTNLLLAELDVAGLPIQPYDSPERQWLVRAAIVDKAGRTVATQDSQPFCRQARRPDQAGVSSVRIDQNNLLYVNDAPFLPWGGVYGHVPVYAGPGATAPTRFRDLHNLPPWGLYDGYVSTTYKRANSDLNSLRYVAGALMDPTGLTRTWTTENQLAASAFISKSPAFSQSDFEAAAGGPATLASNLAFAKDAPSVVSLAPGIEEAFGLFQTVTPDQLSHLEQIVSSIRRATGKPVMIGHGGYWNRFEFERVPFFDIYDPETEPLYPANLHTDLMPLIGGKAKTAWLRPQMYEDVPYERWRFHVYVELMRGARGFQIAHGPGDVSLFRGLGGELDGLKPVLWSTDPGPDVHVSPAMEHWSRRYDSKTYIIAATTHGLTLGKWSWLDETEKEKGPHGRVRVTEKESTLRDEANSYGVGEPPAIAQAPRLHGIQYLPDAHIPAPDSRLVQWVWLDPKNPPKSLSVLLKADGRFTHAATWGAQDLESLSTGPKLEWFLRSVYRHASGFLGWGKDLVDRARQYAPLKSLAMGDLPPAGVWMSLELPLSAIDAQGRLIDGVAFLHDGGRVVWGRTSIRDAKGEAREWVLWGDSLAPAPAERAVTKVEVEGLTSGVKIRVLFEDREIVASDGFFVDDFRGRDLYQRFGGGPGVGYGDEPVALHIYEVPGHDRAHVYSRSNPKTQGR